MPDSLSGPDSLAGPEFDDPVLAAAEQRADVRIRAHEDLSDLRLARWVCDQVWPVQSANSATNGATQIQANLLKAIVHAGGYASVAYRDGEPIGAALGFVGRHRVESRGPGHERSPRWHQHLHSHMAAVLEPYRDQHVGAALKYHQRAWCLAHDLDTVVWTFDPLVRRNARLNLLKLGADVDGFEINFYGSMDDGINSGDASDRLFAWWRLRSPRAQAAAAGGLAPMALSARDTEAGGRDLHVVELPEDIVSLRASDPGAAAAWRLRVREQLLEHFEAGYRIIGITHDDGYVLERA